MATPDEVIDDLLKIEIRMRVEIMKGRGMLLVREGCHLQPWSVVRHEGVEYVVLHDPSVQTDDGYLVPPLPAVMGSRT